MNNTINLNYLTRMAENLSRSGAIQRSQGSDFLSMAVQLRSVGSSTATIETSELSMEAYQQTIKEKISHLPLSATRQMESISVHISDAAFERMRSDPDYETWVLNDLREAFSQTNPWVTVCGGGYSVFSIGATKEECHAEGWFPDYLDGQDAAMFEEKNEGSFWERRMESHKKFMELQQEAATRRRIMMKLRLNDGSVSAAEILLGLL